VKAETMTPETDQALLLAYADHRNADAFAALVERYAPLVYATARRVTRNAADAEDVAQQCFLELARSARSIRASLPAWLHRVAATRSLNCIRDRATRKVHETAAGTRDRGKAPSDADWPELEAAIASSQGTSTMPATQPASASTNGRVVLDGIAPLRWGKSGETTFLGALSAALGPSDRPRDYATLMGNSAVAFRARWYRGPANRRWSGASTVAEHGEERTRLAEAIGIPLEAVWAFPDRPNRVETLARVISSIDAGRPVLGYLSPAFDVAVIYGYDMPADSFFVRDYYDQADTRPLRPATRLGGFFVFMGEPTSPPATPRDAIVAGIRAAIHNWTRNDRPAFDEDAGEFIYGPAAYQAWIEDLQSADTLTDDQKKLLFDTSNWTLNCLNDARWAACRYLRESAVHFDDADIRNALIRAAGLYEQHARATGGPTWGERTVFLGPWSGKTVADWTAEIRLREIGLLQQAMVFDAQAIEQLRAALDRYEGGRN
jgi:RNA polymerase sigma factor (sigma-70 family)